MIDLASGQINLEAERTCIGPNTTRDMFAAMFGAETTDLVVNEPWHSFRLVTTLVRIPFVLCAWFHGNVLEMVDLAAIPPELGSSWADWSEQSELQRKALHDKLLQQNIGQSESAHAYPWGSVSSVFDQIAGASIIVIRYTLGKGE